MEERIGMSKKDTAVLKGLAAIIMVFHHCFRTESVFQNYTINFAPFTQDFIVAICAAFKLCVPIYVFISGYGLTLNLKKLHEDYVLSSRELTRWYVGRYIRLMAGYWFIYLSWIVIGQAALQRFTTTFFASGRVLGLLQTAIDFVGVSKLIGTPVLCGAWWYMSCAIVLVFLIPFLTRLSFRYGSLAILAGIVIMPRLFVINQTENSSYPFVFMAMLGVACAQHNVFNAVLNFRLCKNRVIDTIAQVLIGLILIAVPYRLYLSIPLSTLWELKYGLFPLAVIFFVVKFISPLPGLSQVLQFFGKHSMNIFLIHLLMRDLFIDEIFGLEHFMLVGGTLLLLSLAASIVIEWLKKLLHYQKGIDALTQFMYRILQLG